MTYLPPPAHPDWLPACGNAIDPEVLAGLVELGGEDEPELILELIDLFLEDAPVRLEALGRACSAHNPDAVSQEAHALKGASATMGANSFSSICKEIEIGARAGEDMSSSLQTGVQSYNCVKEALTRLREICAGSEGEEVRSPA